MAFQSNIKALRIIENEHMLIRKMMNDWYEVSNSAKETKELMPFLFKLKILRQKMTIFLEVLEKHQEKEEKYFFKVLEAYVGEIDSPVSNIREEHDEMNQYFQHFMLHSTAGKELKDYALLLEDLQEGFEILMVHMYKEESVLFTISEKVLKKKDEDVLLESMNTLIY